MGVPPATVLYHYTTATALNSILREAMLLPSLRQRRPSDVRYGEGQYLTDVLPGERTGAQLSRLLIGHPFEAQRFTHFIALDVAGLIIVQGRPNVFVVPGSRPLDITHRIAGTGRNTADDLHQSNVETHL